MEGVNWQLMANKAYELGTEWLIKLLGALVILFIGSLVIKFVVNLMKKLLDKSGVDLTVVGFLETVVKISLKVILWLMVLGNLGVKTTSFIAIVGSAGLAIGLALQGSLSNIGAGVLLIILRPFKVGDYVTGGGQSGTIKEIGIFNTIMITPDNKMIIVPNSKISSDSITNFSAMETRRVDFVFGIGYDDDLKLAKETLNEIIKADSRVLSDPAHLVVVSELGDSSVNFTVRAWVKPADYWSFYFDTIEKVKLTFDEKGISIPFPQRDVHLYQENPAA
ncbi:MAG: small conductance mechanosensitive channel [Clostridiales bacterium]|jgi:small conductance mechanosensitive channel|nr:small conductance mechanosensitive channel [Clostridiales bacterium]MDN5283409.1 small conductance mechanosensitive channel [Candidatus Ozemobacter sp.]